MYQSGDIVKVDRSDCIVDGTINKVILCNRNNPNDDETFIHTTLLVNMPMICPRRGIEVNSFARFYIRRNGQMFQSSGWKLV